MTSEVQVLAVGLFSSLGVGVLGLGAAYLLRRRSLAWQLVVLVLTTALAILAGVLALSQQLFVTARGLEVVALVSATAVLVGLAAALTLAAWATRWAQALGVGARRVGRGATYAAEPVWPRELRLVSQQLEDARRRLEREREREHQVEQSRRDLISWLAHDLQGPLLRLRNGLDEPGAVALEADRMGRIVDDLTELSRIHAGALHLDPEELMVEEVVREAVAAVKPVARERGIKVTGVVEPGLRMRVDAVAMTRVLVHLVDEGLRHAPTGGVVEARARGVDGHVEIAVSDGCATVPLDDRPEAATEGPGVGPAHTIVTGIVEAHSGSLEVETVSAHSAVRGLRPGCRYVLRVPPGLS